METEARLRQSKEAKQAKVQRHNDNLSIFSGRHRGIYYENGVANPRKPIEIGGRTGIIFNVQRLMNGN